jgi:hypothetical protein
MFEYVNIELNHNYYILLNVTQQVGAAVSF